MTFVWRWVRIVFGMVIFFGLLTPIATAGFIARILIRTLEAGWDAGANFRFPNYRKLLRKHQIINEPEIPDELWNEFLKGWRKHASSEFTPSGKGDPKTGRLVTFAERLQGKRLFEARAMGEAEGRAFAKDMKDVDLSELIRQAKDMLPPDDDGPKGA